MYNPFQILTDAFQADYRVNLSLERLDGNIMLTLADDSGVVARRMISPAQRNDPKRLQRVIESIRFGIAIEKGGNVSEMLTAMTSGKPLPPLARPQVGGTGGSLGAGY
ncbi:DUF3509 domain-containing protein [Pseudomonas sp. A29(2023)]|uniref:DUF3509 domain-containing protein n=1 Tax=Metapseudomonas otitidis TaxID=319939 RepID=UPI0027385D9B|nr:DUF3509 domain-containing protein [Pseudomonas sp. A29(2023)]MDL5596323.1 DUF3509 domain-containing protein [Bacillus subtilis]